jgi:hypothetical protein
MTPEEKEILHRLSAKAQRYAVADSSGKNSSKNPQQAALDKSVNAFRSEDEEDDVLHTDIYAANLSLLNK